MDVAVTRMDLTRPVHAAASDGTTVWCAGDGGVRAYATDGTAQAGDPRGEGLGLRSLAAVPGTVPGTAGLPGTLAETVVVPRSFAGTSPSDPLPRGTLAGASEDHIYWFDPSGAPIASV